MLNSTHLPVEMHNRTYQECKQQQHTLCPGSTGVHYKVPLLYHNWKKNPGVKSPENSTQLPQEDKSKRCIHSDCWGFSGCNPAWHTSLTPLQSPHKCCCQRAKSCGHPCNPGVYFDCKNKINTLKNMLYKPLISLNNYNSCGSFSKEENSNRKSLIRFYQLVWHFVHKRSCRGPMKAETENLLEATDPKGSYL